MEIERELNIKIRGTETSAGYETKRSFGKVLNPRIILSKIHNKFDNCDGSVRDENKLINGNNTTTETDSGNCSSNYNSGSGHDSYGSYSKSESDKSDSGSSSDVSSSVSAASSISGKENVAWKNPCLTIEEYREFVMKVKNLHLLTITAVRTKFKSKYAMVYIISNTEQQTTDGKVRMYDKILAINDEQLDKYGFDIERLVTFTDSNDDVFNIKLEIRRWVPEANQPEKYNIKDVTVEYTITRQQKHRNPRLTKKPPFSEKRQFRDLRWVGKPRKVVLRMDEYTGYFVFVDDNNDLRIGTIPGDKKYYYHFLIRPFTCLVQNQNQRWSSKGGVTFTYHHGNIYLDIKSDLANGDTELGVKNHQPFNIEKPDERFFLKHENDDFDPDSQRYESLLHKDMCFKFDKESKKFMLGHFHVTNPSVGDYFFETFSISVISGKEDNEITNVTNEEITAICPLEQDTNPRTLIKNARRRKKKSFYRAFGNLFCCSGSRDVSEFGDRYVKVDNDDVLKFFKTLSDTTENSQNQKVEDE